MPELYDPKIEKALIATLVTSPQAIGLIEPDLNPEYFRDARCKAAASGLLYLYRKHQAITPTVLADALLGLNLLDQAGGLSHIEALFSNGAEPATGIDRLLSIVKDHWCRRQELVLSREIEDTAQDRTQDSQTRFGKIKEGLQKLEASLSEKSGHDSQSQFDYYLNLLEKRKKNADIPQLLLPWQQLQEFVPSLPIGTLTGILGNPGSGKTALMECISEAWWQQGFFGIYYHAEDSLDYKIDRRMARWAGVNYGKSLEPEEYQAVLNTWQMIDKWPGDLVLVHCPGWSMRKILAHASRHIQEHRIDYLAIDYLNKLAWDDRGLGLNSAQMRGADIEQMKEFLERFGLVGLIAGQFDKSAKGKRNRELSDLRDSGELDDKAQVGLIIERKKNPDGEWEPFGQLRVSKCNFGRTGVSWIRFVGKRYLFTDRADWKED